jgi:Tol biopolymer transport system component
MHFLILYPLSVGAAASFTPQSVIEIGSVRNGVAVEANAESKQVRVAADGMAVAFVTAATNLHGADTNGVDDVYVQRFDDGSFHLVSIGQNGVAANGGSIRPSMGRWQWTRYVAFQSDASNLVSGDTNGFTDIFVRDLDSQSTTRVSVASNGEANGASRRPSMSRHGNFIAFESDGWSLVTFDGNGLPDVYGRSYPGGWPFLITFNSQGVAANGGSFAPSTSDNGSVVAFESVATDLVGGDSNAKRDIFCWNGSLTRVSVSSLGVQANGDSRAACVSADGRFVAFVSDATNLVAGDTNGQPDVFVHDRSYGTTVIESVSSLRVASNGASSAPSLSADGRMIAFETLGSTLFLDDNNSARDIVLRDRVSGFTRRASSTWEGGASNGESREPTISEGGEFVAFASAGNNMVPGDGNSVSDAFMYDVGTGTSARFSTDGGAQRPSGDFYNASTSPTGRFVVFESSAGTLIPGDTNGSTDVFLRDRELGVSVIVSRSTGGGQVNGSSWDGCITSDGRHAAFTSNGSNLTPQGNYGPHHVYVHDRTSQVTVLASLSSNNLPADNGAGGASISADARFITFWARAGNWGFGGNAQIFVRDRLLGRTELISQSSSGSIGEYESYAPQMSPDGRYIVFESRSSNLTLGDSSYTNDVFRFDRATAEMRRITPGNDQDSSTPSISDDGRFVAFQSLAALVPSDNNGTWDVYVADLTQNTFVLASATQSGAIANGPSDQPYLASNGSAVVFVSSATNMLGGTLSNLTRIYVRDLVGGGLRVESVSNAGVLANQSCTRPSISGDGSCVVFDSPSRNLLPVDWGNTKVFVRDSTPALSYVYCAAKVNSQGCAPRIEGVGTPSLSSGLPYWVTAVRIINQKNGLLFYGFAPNNVPFQDATLCVAPPTVRTTMQSSGGLVGPEDCTGTFQLDMNAWARSGADARLVPGADVHCQYWYRDPALVGPNKTGLSDALRFTYAP